MLYDTRAVNTLNAHYKTPPKTVRIITAPWAAPATMIICVTANSVWTWWATGCWWRPIRCVYHRQKTAGRFAMLPEFVD